MKRVGLAICAVALLLGGCARAAWVRPVEVRRVVLANPRVGEWYRLHSAPAVLAGMGPADAMAWRRYQPDMTIDIVKEGLRVYMRARFGPEPRRMEVFVDRQTGAILDIRDDVR